MKTRIILFLALVSIALTGIVIASVTGWNPWAVSAIVLAFTLFVKTPERSLLNALSITELTTKLGDYFRSDKDTIFSKLLLGMNIDDRFDVWDDCADEVPMPNLLMEDIVQPGLDPTFSPTADAIKFGARVLKVRDWKVDLQIIPKVLHKSWLAKYKKKGSDVFDMPFEQYVMEAIIKKAQENIRLKALYKGVYNGAGSAPADIFNGLLKLVADEITATNIAAQVTGVITADNVIDKVLIVYDGLGEAYKGVPTIIPASPTIFDWYVRKDKALYGANTNQEKMQRTAVQIDGTMCTLLREPGLAGSQRLICTTPDNAVYGVDSLNDSNNIEIQKFDRTLKLLIDAKAGVDFKQIDADCLSVNDQA